MAIATLKPNAKPNNTQPEPITGEPKTYKSVVYDDMHNVPVSSLLAYIDGYPWYVDYYGQITSEHSELKEVDAALPSIYQPYRKINGLELRVSSTLNSSFNQQNNFTEVTGSAVIYPFLVPNKGDYFITDAGQNQMGLFLITSVTRKTFNRDSVYEIDYELKGYLDQVKDQVETLKKSTVREYYFSKDRLIEGLSPILKTKDFHFVRDVKQIYEDIVKYYFSTFFNREYHSLCLPGQRHAIYDHFVNNFLYKIVDVDDILEMQYNVQYGRQQDTYMHQPQFWDVLMEKSYKHIKGVNKEMGMISRSYFAYNTWLSSMRYSCFDYVMYPVNPDTSIQVKRRYPIVRLRGAGKQPSATTSNTNLGTDTSSSVQVYGEPGYYDWYEDDYYFFSRNQCSCMCSGCSCDGCGMGDGDNGIYGGYFDREDQENPPLIHPVLVDRYYVLSEQFYKDTDKKSQLEILTRDYANGKTIDKDMFLRLANDYHEWPRLEQFYYLPIMMVLAKELQRSMYS